MTLKECYERLEGDYSDVMGRLFAESVATRILFMFLEDPSFTELTKALEEGNVELAFRGAHTLKGVCANLSLTRLYHSAVELTELLRAGNLEEGKKVYPTVKLDYEMTIAAIKEYKDSL